MSRDLPPVLGPDEAVVAIPIRRFAGFTQTPEGTSVRLVVEQDLAIELINVVAASESGEVPA